MTPYISIGNRIFARAILAVFLLLIANQTFAQTVSETPTNGERTAFPSAATLDVGVEEGLEADGIGQSVPYIPPTGRDRLKWAVDGTLGASSIATGVFIASWNAAWNLPSEWDRSWSGFAKRFGAREAQMTISNAIESGLGAAWGEDPRYFRSGRARASGRGPGTRQRPCSLRAVAAATWLLPGRGMSGRSEATSLQIAGSHRAKRRRPRTSAESARILGRFVANLWTEFWPDVRGRMKANEDHAGGKPGGKNRSSLGGSSR
jgi:hypothetical protein